MSYAMTPPPFFWEHRGRHGRMAASMIATSEEAPEEPGRGRRRKHRHGPQFDFGGPGPRGPRGPWGGPGPWGPGRRRERGDVRAAVLLLLAEKPRHGYEIITELADRSDGRWRPSPGSVYPVLKRLAREGLVDQQHVEGRRIFTLTNQGRAFVEEHRESWGEPWSDDSPGDDLTWDLVNEGRQLAAAAWQVAQTADAAQIQQVSGILADARKQIYRILAGE